MPSWCTPSSAPSLLVHTPSPLDQSVHLDGYVCTINLSALVVLALRCMVSKPCALVVLALRCMVSKPSALGPQLARLLYTCL